MKKADLEKALKKVQKEKAGLINDQADLTKKMHDIASENLLLTSKLEDCRADKDALQTEVNNLQSIIKVYKESQAELLERVGARIENATNVHIAGYIAAGMNSEIEIKGK